MECVHAFRNSLAQIGHTGFLLVFSRDEALMKTTLLVVQPLGLGLKAVLHCLVNERLNHALVNDHGRLWLMLLQHDNRSAVQRVRRCRPLRADRILENTVRSTETVAVLGETFPCNAGVDWALVAAASTRAIRSVAIAATILKNSGCQAKMWSYDGSATVLQIVDRRTGLSWWIGCWRGSHHHLLVGVLQSITRCPRRRRGRGNEASLQLERIPCAQIVVEG